MKKIKKVFLKIISAIISILLLFNTAVYAYSFSKHTLRVRSIFQDGALERIEGALTYFAGLIRVSNTSGIEKGLKELKLRGEGLLVFRPIKGQVEAAYIDWGALSSLTPEERRELFNLLHSYGIGVNILTYGGVPYDICDILEKEWNLGYVKAVITTNQTFMGEEQVTSYKDSDVAMVFNTTSKTAYLKNLTAASGRPVLFMDDNARHFFIPQANNVITVGIIRKKTPHLDYLLGERCALASYYIVELNDFRAISRLMDFIMPLLSADSQLIQITDNTKEWSPNMDIVTPVDETSIPGFEKWIVWNNAASHLMQGEGEAAFDWAAYLNKDGEVILGLPVETRIRAIADGLVVQVFSGLGRREGYATLINIEHGKKGNGLYSSYGHVVPLVKPGERVKKGDIIAKLYKDPGGAAGRLVHLHFTLSNGWEVKDRILVDPERTIYANTGFLHAKPQGSLNFQLAELGKNQPVTIANFRTIKIGRENLDEVIDGLIRAKEFKRPDISLIVNDPYAALTENQMRRLRSAL